MFICTLQLKELHLLDHKVERLTKVALNDGILERSQNNSMKGKHVKINFCSATRLFKALVWEDNLS